MDVQDQLDQNQDGSDDSVIESAGMQAEDAQPEGEAPSDSSNPEDHSRETLAVQKRLKAQKRAHEREMREMQARIAEMENRLAAQGPKQDQELNPFGAPASGNVDETIQKAVSYALRQKEMEERKAREAQEAADFQRSYQDFSKHLDSMNDKYDDFHDVVMGNDVPFTSHMRDYALTLPKSGAGSAGEVLYKLGKNRPELERISKLRPWDQASELAKLSHALIAGQESKGGREPAPLSNIRSNPTSNSHAVTERTPVSSIRERMKSGAWK